MKHLHRALVLALLLSLWPLSIGAASATPRGALAGELVLKLRPGAMLDADARAHGPHAALLDALLRAAGAGAAASLGSNSDTYRVRLRGGADLAALAPRPSANPAAGFPEPNPIRTLMRPADDPAIGRQWALPNIPAL